MRRIALAILWVGLLSTPGLTKEKYAKPGPVHLDHDGEKWAEKTLRKLSLEEKVGQLFMIRLRVEFMNVGTPAYLQLRDTIRQYHLGSLAMTVPWEPPFLYRTGPLETAELLNRLQSDSRLPLLIAADFERGLTMRVRGGTEFPHAMAFGAAGKVELAEAFGRITAQEARALGVHWNFFPVADVNSNPANPIINTRAFSEDPRQVEDMVAAYIRGARSNGMLTTVKHFPGHGDTATDSHLGLSQVTGDRTRLDAVELAPFRGAVQEGVDAVMVAHVSVPALEPDPNRVATTSPAVVTRLLKERLGFHGIVVTDALEMAGLTRLYSSHIGREAVDAFKAGNDVLLMPANLDASYQALLNAVRSGEVPTSQLDASVLKILKTKAEVGLDQARLVNLAEIPLLVGKPENQAIGRQVADEAVTLVRDNGRVLPLKGSGTAPAALPYQRLEEVRNDVVVIVISDDTRAESGHVLERDVHARVPTARIIRVDAQTAAPRSEEILNAVDQAKTVVAAAYLSPVAGRAIQGAKGLTNSVALPDSSGDLLQKILARAAQKTVVVALGNPYLAADFPAAQNYICTFSVTDVSEASAVKALFGEISIRGRLPVSIPNIAQRGAGIERPASVAEGGSYAHSQTSGR